MGDNKWFAFNPQASLQVWQIAEILKMLDLKISREKFESLNPILQQHFIREDILNGR